MLRDLGFFIKLPREVAVVELTATLRGKQAELVTINAQQNDDCKHLQA